MDHFPPHLLMRSSSLLLLLVSVLSPLSAAPLISEFLADNSTSIVDSDGAHSDWIEITNPDATPVNLLGWTLTDTPGALGKWAFPSTSIAPGGYLIVFASGKNRAVSGAQLHTNFSISKKAGYLALTAPGGSTASSFYNYPAQKTDVTYGLAKQTTTAYPISSAASSVFVPTGGSAPDAGWITTGFAPGAAWLASPTPPGTGYDTTSPAPTPANIAGSGTATQSTTLYPYTANLGSNALTTDYTQTINADTTPFWNLDFGSDAVITSIVITNRTASQSRLRDLTVSILNDAQDAIYSSALLNPENTLAGPATLTVDLVALTGGTVTGRHVRIARTADADLSGNGGTGDDADRYALSLAEVTVNGSLALVNLARSGSPAPTAVQTSTNSTYTAALAVDGINTNFTHTLATTAPATEPTPAWTLNLNRKAAINLVSIHNRELCCNERLRDITVEIYDADPGTGLTPTNPPIHTSPLLNPANVLKSPPDLIYNIAAANGSAPIIGQWVRIKRTPDAVTPITDTSIDDLRVLSMGEVQVKGTELSGYRPFIRKDLQTAMQNNSPTAYLRVPFNVADVATTVGLALRIRYDDGFVAYVNGAEVARRNAPTTPDQTSVATVKRTSAQGATSETIDVSAAVPSLLATGNVLAIHGLNAAASDTNFLLQPELLLTQAPVVPPAFLTNATPAAINATTWYLDTVKDTAFSHRRGFYNTPLNLAITSLTAGAEIYFTLDNSEPTPGNGVRYTAPVLINKTSVVRARAYKTNYKPTNIDTHTYIFLDDVTTAAKSSLTTAGVVAGTIPPGWPTSATTNGGQAFNFGFTSSLLTTPTAYTPAQLRTALTQIPSVSVVTQQNNLTDPTTGIYVNGTNGHGDNYERPGSIEMLDFSKPGLTPEDGHGEFSEAVGLRLRGGASRNDSYTKHSFRVFFKTTYGNGKLSYPLYGNAGASQFDTFDLRGAQNYSWSNGSTSTEETLVRDPFSLELLGAMGQPYTRSRFVHLYLNGLYWGIFEIQERPENSFAESYIGGSKDNYDVVKNRDRYSSNLNDAQGNLIATSFSTEATNGYLKSNPDNSRAAWKELWDRTLAIWQTSDSSSASYYRLLGCNPDGTRNPAYPVLLDVDNLIDYTLALFYTGDGDACLSGFLSFNTPNNWFGMRDRLGNRGFVFLNHDAEHTLKASSWSGSRAPAATDQTGPFGGTNQTLFLYSNPQWMHEELMNHPEYKLRYADHIRRHFFNGGALTPVSTKVRWSARVNTITQAIIPYAARWATTTTAIGTWNALCIGPNGAGAIDNIPTDFLDVRTTDLLAQLKVDGLYPATEAPDYSQFGGAVPANYSLALTTPTSGGIIYYTTDGSDPRVTQELPTPVTLVAKTAPRTYHVSTSKPDGFTETPGSGTVSPGPIGWWKLDGNVTDSGTGLNNGVVQNAPTYTTDRNGVANAAMLLNGTNQTVQLLNPTNLQIVNPVGTVAGTNNVNKISFGAWVKPTASDGLRDIIAKGYNQGGTAGEIILRINAGAVEGGTYTGTTFAASAAGAATLNVWQHFCVVYDGTAWRLYKNGAQIAALTTNQGPVAVAGTTVQNNYWNIGARGGSPTNGNRYFAGSIDEVMIFNRALTPAEVTTLYSGADSTYTPVWKDPAYSVPGTWLTGGGGFGYDTEATVDYTPFITNNLQSTMQNVPSTLLTRVTFNVSAAQLASLSYLQLNTRYDDGFVAYLNGTKFLERNAPTGNLSLHGTATATAVRLDADGATPEKTNVTTAALPLLVAGNNVLAIQGFNTTAADNDFLLETELVAGDKTVYLTATAQVYSGPLTLTSSQVVRARTWNPATGQWSALSEAYFSVDTIPASASNLVISELHYHPANPSTAAELAVSTNPDDFEFVEVMNISPTSKVEMTGVAFTNGLTYTFGHVVLAPGARAVLVANLAAFTARYGNGLSPLGVYVGALSNSSEHIVLNNAAGGIIKDFRYNTDATWPTEPDGTGPSLTLMNPTNNPDHNLGTSWRASLANGGSAGGTDATIYSQWKASHSIATDAADDDHDGLNALIEYAFGADPAVPSQAQLPAATPQPDGSITISFTPPPGADDVGYSVEISNNLTTWQNPGAALTDLGTTNGVRSWSLAAGTGNRRYWHVTATLR